MQGNNNTLSILENYLHDTKPYPFSGDFGIFEDSLPDGYGRCLLHKALIKEGVNDFELSALDRLSLVGSGGIWGFNFSSRNLIATWTRD